ADDTRADGSVPVIAAAAREPSDVDELPLGFAPERERTALQKSRRRTWMATLVIFTLLILGGGGLWLYNTVNRPAPLPPQVKIPAVAALTESAALQELYGANLRPQIKRNKHETIPSGTAIGTDPVAGTSVDPNAEVILNISEGPSAIKIPETLPGQTEAAARDILRQNGLQGAASTTTANSATVPAGRVITTSPAPGQMVGVGTTVEIVISTGKVSMPGLINLPRAEAEAALKELGLVPNIQEVENSEVAAGIVTGQSEQVNAAVDQGKTINIEVAKAPAPPPTPTPTATPTPTKKG
ncbi:MAG: PASTA domain-containing protein, partial [Actinomycetota bacterium]|nr:PASTA domain-containing protein [Actinomycetota bacterium]